MAQVVKFEPSNLKFDPKLEEYSLEIGNYFLDVSHCPFCGEKTPESKQQIEKVSEKEKERLIDLMADCDSKAELVDTLGIPDFESAAAISHDRLWKENRTFSASAIYKNLSGTANIRVVFDVDDAIIQRSIEPKIK